MTTTISTVKQKAFKAEKKKFLERTCRISKGLKRQALSNPVSKKPAPLRKYVSKKKKTGKTK